MTETPEVETEMSKHDDDESSNQNDTEAPVAAVPNTPPAATVSAFAPVDTSALTDVPAATDEVVNEDGTIPIGTGCGTDWPVPTPVTPAE